LHAAGIDTFFAEWEIAAGQSLRGKIDEGLEDCTHFIVLLTETSLLKPWVNAEIDAAFVKKVNGTAVLIPLRYQLKANRLPPLLGGLHSPVIEDYQADIRRLVDDIRGISRKPPVQTVAPTTRRMGNKSRAVASRDADRGDLRATLGEWTT